MKLVTTNIADISVIETTVHMDARGAFARLYCEQELSALIKQRRIVQINHSRTSAVGAVRGLHFQYPPHAEMKLVRCIKGCIWDVAVDLRKHSSNYLQWHAELLTPTNARMMVIPEGFAHGFQVMEPDSELLYLHTAVYTPSAESGLRYDDPKLKICWPLPVSDVSERDKNHTLIEANFGGIIL